MMTKGQLLKGEAFSLQFTHDQTTTYVLSIEEDKSSKLGLKASALHRQYRHSNSLSLLLEDHIFNIEKMGSKKIHVYTFLLGKRIKDTIKYKDMVPFAGEIIEE